MAGGVWWLSTGCCRGWWVAAEPLSWWWGGGDEVAAWCGVTVALHGSGDDGAGHGGACRVFGGGFYRSGYEEAFWVCRKKPAGKIF
nr:hypothetical protein [Tanacetum cinerariifolium]